MVTWYQSKVSSIDHHRYTTQPCPAPGRATVPNIGPSLQRALSNLLKTLVLLFNL